MAQNPPPNASAEDERPTLRSRISETIPDQIIVKFREGTTASARAEIRRQEGLDRKKDLNLINAEVDKVKGQSAQAAIRALERRPEVEYATPDRTVYAAGYADEPRFSELWGLHNTGQVINGVTGTANVDVNGLEASARTQGDPALTVAVVDTGVDFSHPDLAGRAWKNPGESGNGKESNGIDDDANGYVDDVNGWDFFNNDSNPTDDNSHGTHVSGTIAASVNGKGVVGVAPNVRIMALKFLGAGGSGSLSGAIEAIGYATEKGVKISNHSWRYVGAPDPALKDAIDVSSGQLFVAAAGNETLNNDADPNNSTYPASYSSANILAVAAINNQGSLASFSSFGKTTVDISAPGVDVLSSIPDNSGLPAVALSSVGSGRAVTAGFGAEEIANGVAAQASFMQKSFTAVNRGTQPVVLVDDDGSSGGRPDVGPTLSTAIQSATGSFPEVISVLDGADGPSLSQLSGKTVVWATGQDFGCGTDSALTPTDQTTLTNFLNGGGKLVLTGLDAMYCIETSSFVTTTLNLSVQSDVGSSTGGDAFRGSSGTAFAGESYDLNGPNSVVAWHDKIQPANSSAATQGNYGSIGGYAYFSGTSMAAPHTAGTAALVASKYPTLSPTSVKSVIMSSGKAASATVGKTVTGKMVNAQAALFPRVTTVSPASGKTGVAKSTNVTAKFSDGMNATTITTTTFKLVKSGATTPVTATVSYNGATKTATLDPSVDLAPSSTYTATVQGGTSGVKNATFNDPMVSSKTWKFTTGA